MTALNAALWGLTIASLVGVMVGGSELAYEKCTGCGCAPNRRATGLLYGSILLGFVAGAANTVFTVAVT